MILVVLDFICYILTFLINFVIVCVILCQPKTRAKGHAILLVCMGTANSLWSCFAVAISLVSLGYTNYMINNSSTWVLQTFASVLAQIFACCLFSINIDQCVYMLTTKKTYGYNTKLCGQILVGLSILLSVITWTPYFAIAATSKSAASPLLLKDAADNRRLNFTDDNITVVTFAIRDTDTLDFNFTSLDINTTLQPSREDILSNKFYQTSTRSTTLRPNARPSSSTYGTTTTTSAPASTTIVPFTTDGGNITQTATTKQTGTEQKDFQFTTTKPPPNSYTGTNKVCNVSGDMNIVHGMYSSVTFTTCNSIMLMTLILTFILYNITDLYSATKQRIKAFMCTSLLYLFLTLPYWILILVDSINAQHQVGCNRYESLRCVHDLATFLVPLFVVILDPEVKDAVKGTCCSCCCVVCKNKHQYWDEESHLMDALPK